MNVAVRRAPSAGGDASAPDPAGKARRPDRRAAKTIDNIVTAAQQVMENHGTAKISARDVCEQAGVSRGTLYRYFSSMDALLQAVALRLRTDTDLEMRHAIESRKTPSEQFTAMLDYAVSNRETHKAAQFLHVEPAFVLRYFEDNFDHFLQRVNDNMASVFDAWERDLGAPLDRGAFCEMMVRYALSETLVPARPGDIPLPLRLRAMVDMVLASKGLPSRP